MSTKREGDGLSPMALESIRVIISEELQKMFPEHEQEPTIVRHLQDASLSSLAVEYELEGVRYQGTLYRTIEKE